MIEATVSSTLLSEKPSATQPSTNSTPWQATMAVLATIEGLSAAAKRAIIANANNEGIPPESLLSPSPAMMATVLKGYPRKSDAIAAWQEALPYLQPEAIWAKLQRLEARLIVWGDADYPRLLSEIHNPPACLFVRGNASALVGKTLAVVGTRKITDYGHQAVKHLTEQLAQTTGATIVSGLAAGVDGAAHRAALAHNLPTVAVFGCGIDTIFPTPHKRLAQQILEAGGALVSEYSPGYPGSQYTYPQRNRIIAGLSYGALIVEGEEKSGSLITARLALEENRSVFALPGSLFNPMMAGPHKLLRDGAVLVRYAEDMTTELGWVTPTPMNETTEQGSLLTQQPAATETMAPDDEAILRHIGYDPTPIETVATRTGLPMTDLQPKLLMLELAGHLTTCPGACVVRR